METVFLFIQAIEEESWVNSTKIFNKGHRRNLPPIKERHICKDTRTQRNKDRKETAHNML